MSPRSPDAPAARRPRSRRLAAALAGLAVAVIAGFTIRGLWPGTARPASALTAVPVSTSAVVRTDVSERQVVSGTLGYQGSFSVADQLSAGIITWLPPAGRVVRRGQPLFQVSGQPVVLMYGQVPAWRTLAPGMTPP